MNKGLLEKFSGAAAAYSVRLLNRSYTGPLLKIRRVDSVSSQDNGEIFVFPDNDGWISLDSKVIDPSHTSLATTLREFLNLGGQPDKDIILSTDPQDAYVVVWKDQSGNANDASQTSTTAQPKLATAGVLVTENGKPAVDFDGAGDELNATAYDEPTLTSIVVTVNDNTAANSRASIIAGAASSKSTMSHANDLSLRYDGAFSAGTQTAATNTQYLRFAVRTTSSQTEHVNGASNVSTSLTLPNASGTINIGRAASTYLHFEGRVQEAVLYSSDQSSNRTDIENNINTFYNIY